LVAPKQSGDALLEFNARVSDRHRSGWIDRHVTDRLAISLAVIVLGTLARRESKTALAQRDDQAPSRNA
jgi:hypothetical protein